MKSKWYEIEDVEFCEGCKMEMEKCYVLGLTEKGFLAGTRFRIVKELNGIVMVEMQEGNRWALDKKLLNQVKTREIKAGQ